MKTYLAISGAEHDSLLNSLIPAVSEAIENYCRRRFAQESLVEYYDGGSFSIILARFPVLSIDSVYTDPSGQLNPGTLISSDSYVLYPDPGLLILHSGKFPSGKRAVKVSYTAGYATIPDDLKQSATMLVSAWFIRARQGADGISSESIADYSVSFGPKRLPPAVRSVLDFYRLQVL